MQKDGVCVIEQQRVREALRAIPRGGNVRVQVRRADVETRRKWLIRLLRLNRLPLDYNYKKIIKIISKNEKGDRSEMWLFCFHISFCLFSCFCTLLVLICRFSLTLLSLRSDNAVYSFIEDLFHSDLRQ